MTRPTRPVVVVGDVMTDVVTGPQVTTRQGGAGANVARWLAASGCPVELVARVGDDPFGREAVALLSAAGVEVRIAVDPRLATGTVVVLEGTAGEQTRLPDAGANSALTVDDLPALTPDTAAWLHVSGHTLMNPGSRPAAEAALARAAATGVPRSVDVVSVAPLEAFGGKEFLRVTDGVELAFCTLDEAEVLAGTRDPGTAVARLTATYREVVLKTGAQGSWWASEGAETVRVDVPPPGEPVVDASGAEDAFAAAYLAALMAGASVRQRLTRAWQAAAEQAAAEQAAAEQAAAEESALSPGSRRRRARRPPGP